MNVPRPLRDLPIFWKLLLPFVLLLIIVGTGAAYIIIRDLGAKSSAALNEELTLRAVKTRSLLHDRELRLLEASNYASNLQGMAAAVERRDEPAVEDLLESVLALKTELAAAAALDASGAPIVDFRRPAPGASPERVAGRDWLAVAPVRQALEGDDTRRSVGFAVVGGETLLVIAAPVCAAPPCAAAGVTVVGLDAGEVVRYLAEGEVDAAAPQDVSLFDDAGHLLAASGPPAPAPPNDLANTSVEQRLHAAGGTDKATAYLPFALDGRPGGAVAVTISAQTAFESMGSVTLRLVALLAVAIVLAVGFGVLLSRLLLRQLSLVVRTARDLGSGQLAARAEVLGADEHGELAVVLNTMAERLQASHQTLERRVEQRTEEIRRLLRDRTDFFAGLSHELRTPLAVIITQAEMVANDQKQASPAGTGAEAIQAAATQLLDLVNDILELARAEAGKVDLDLVSVELAEVAGEVQPMLERLATSAGVQLAIHIPARVPAVLGDPARLRDVLMNLVDNAIKYTPAGGAVDVTARREGNHVRVSVADTGVGIPPKVGDRIFEPFYRVRGTAPQQDQASSGLGLALSRQWIDAHGGTLTWEPRPGAGTVFSFTVPRHVRRRAPTTERQQPPATLASVGRPREKP